MCCARILFFSILLSLCSCEHKSMVEPIYVCDNASQLVFSDVHSITLTKCSSSGCHDGSKLTIPTLLTQQEWKDNSGDGQGQIMRGAMPPSGSPQLTSIESSKILCLINQGAN